jgi:hypothetical protein
MKQPNITKSHIDQLEREVMRLVPRGKPYQPFKQCFNDFREATDLGAFR